MYPEDPRGAGIWPLHSEVLRVSTYPSPFTWGIGDSVYQQPATWDQGGQDPITPRRVSK
jgi:hypothetical protein